MKNNTRKTYCNEGKTFSLHMSFEPYNRSGEEGIINKPIL